MARTCEWGYENASCHSRRRFRYKLIKEVESSMSGWMAGIGLLPSVLKTPSDWHFILPKDLPSSLQD